MAQTKASALASISTRTQSCRLQHKAQFAQDSESEVEVEMREAAVAPVGGPSPQGPIKKACSSTDMGDGDLVYNRNRFHKFKAQCRYMYYIKREIVVERGVEVANLNACAPRIQAVLDAQGWTELVEDHRPTIEDLVCEFYSNLYKRAGDSSYRSERMRFL